MKQVVALTCCAILCIAAATAAAAENARVLVDRSVEASGGMEALGGWTTMIRTGELTVNWPGWGHPLADCTLRVKRPGKLMLDQDFSAHDHPFFFTYYYNDGDVWAVVNLGVRESPRYTEAMSRAMKNVAGMYYYAAECDTFFLAGPVPDDSLVAGSSVERVGILDHGDTVMIDLDRDTRLPVRLLRDHGSEQTLFSDYREVGGIRMPFRMTVYRDGAVSAEYVWKTTVLDEPIDDAVFEEYRPAEEPSG